MSTGGSQQQHSTSLTSTGGETSVLSSINSSNNNNNDGGAQAFCPSASAMAAALDWNSDSIISVGNGGHTAVTSAGPAEWIGSGEALIAMAATAASTSSGQQPPPASEKRHPPPFGEISQNPYIDSNEHQPQNFINYGTDMSQPHHQFVPQSMGSTSSGGQMTADTADLWNYVQSQGRYQQHLPPAYRQHYGGGVPPPQIPQPSMAAGQGSHHYGGAVPSSSFWSAGGLGPHFVRGPVSISGSSHTVLSRDSSRDDLASLGLEGPIFEYEERFRVDRRKLELLILGRFDPIRESAADFFTRIGEETGSTIIWPSRLKVGAKSKKDPNIRVGGTETAVRRAKFRIMTFLDTKNNRVTMKMDVSYTDHSHIIGKGGNTIRRVMIETGCHIHFPDSNRSNPTEKSNQVSIAGEIKGVEVARARIRELSPLIFTFDLPVLSSYDQQYLHPPDLGDSFIKTIQDQYNVQVTYRQKQKNFHTTMVVVKGCEWEAARVKEATLQLIDHMCAGAPPQNRNSQSAAPSTPTPRRTLKSSNSGMRNDVDGYGEINNNNVDLGGAYYCDDDDKNVFADDGGSSSGGSGGGSGGGVEIFPVTMTMEITPQHHPVVLGKGNMTLKLIMQRTNTTILFPDAADPNIPSIRKGSVTISGSIHNVYFARQQLIGSLPLVMVFDVPDDSCDIPEESVNRLQNDLDILVSVKPKARQMCKSIVIKAQERNASNIYKARSILLGITEDEEIPIKATIPETYNLGSSRPLEASSFASTFAENNLDNKSLLYESPTRRSSAAFKRHPPAQAGGPRPPLPSTAADSNNNIPVVSIVTGLKQQNCMTPKSNNNNGRPPSTHPNLLPGAPYTPTSQISNHHGGPETPSNGGSVLGGHQPYYGNGAGRFLRGGGGISHHHQTKPYGQMAIPPPQTPAFFTTSHPPPIPPHQRPPPSTPWTTGLARMMHPPPPQQTQQQPPPSVGPQANFMKIHQPPPQLFLSAGNDPSAASSTSGGSMHHQPPPPFPIHGVDDPNNNHQTSPYLQEYAQAVLNHIKWQQQQTQQQQQQQQQQLFNQRLQPQANNAASSGVRQSSGCNSPPIPGLSPRNSSPTHDDGNLSKNLAKIDITNSTLDSAQKQKEDVRSSKSSTSSSSSTSKSVIDSGVAGSSGIMGGLGLGGSRDSSSSAGTVKGGQQKGSTTSARSSTSSNVDPFSGDPSADRRRAPGAEKNFIMKAGQPQQIENDFLDLNDYERKRLMASKAMHSKPVAHKVRTPTPGWSGFGFSNSMPENAIVKMVSGEAGKSEALTEETEAEKEEEEDNDPQREENNLILLNPQGGGGKQKQNQQQRSGADNRKTTKANNKDKFSEDKRAGGQKHDNNNKKYPPEEKKNSHQKDLKSNPPSKSPWFANSSAVDALLAVAPKTSQTTAASLGVSTTAASEDDLAAVFARHSLAKYSELFIRHEIDLQTFATLDDKDLKEIGVQTFGARRKLLLLANKVKQEQEISW